MACIDPYAALGCPKPEKYGGMTPRGADIQLAMRITERRRSGPGTTLGYIAGELERGIRYARMICNECEYLKVHEDSGRVCGYRVEPLWEVIETGEH